MIFLLKFIQMVRVLVEENNLAVISYQLLVNDCKYPDVPILMACEDGQLYCLYCKYFYMVVTQLPQEDGVQKKWFHHFF